MEDDRDSWRNFCGAGYEYNVYPENYDTPEEYEADLAKAIGERHANVSTGPNHYYRPNPNKGSSNRGAAPESDKNKGNLSYSQVNETVLKEGDFEYEETNGGIRIDAYKPEKSTKEVVIPEKIAGKKVVEIGNFAFAGWDEIERVVIPEGVWALGEGVFWGCYSLSAVVLPESLKKIETDLKTKHGLTFRRKTLENNPSFAPDALAGTFNCTDIEEIIIPSGVERIGISCFNGCTNLKNVVLPETLTLIEKEAFSFCISLVSLELPDHLKEIDYGAFSFCTILKSVYIPDSVVKIQDDVFNLDDSVTIFCNPGSYAEKYAEEQHIRHTHERLDISFPTEEASINDSKAVAAPKLIKQIEVMDDTFTEFGLKVLQVSNADLSGTIFGKECLSFFVELQSMPEAKSTGRIALKANVYDSEDTLIAMGSESLDLDNFAGYDTLEIQVVHSSLQDRAAKARIFAVKA